MEEQWKIIDFASNYEVSNTGFIRNKTTKYILPCRFYLNIIKFLHMLNTLK